MSVPALAPPPPGPGVQPPFAAPPTDGTRRRRWLAIGLSVAAVVVCCLGGLGGLVGLGVLYQKATVEGATAAVSGYLNALAKDDFTAAYKKLCAQQRTRVDEQGFAQEASGQRQIQSFELGQPDVADTIGVPATLHYADGGLRTLTYLVEVDPNTQAYGVCGTRG